MADETAPPQDRTADIVIIGAGVAGSTLARFLSDDKDVVVLDPKPGRYKVGESIIPEFFHHPVMRELGELAKELPSWAPKGGITFWSGQDVASFPLPEHGRAVAMHVARHELERLMHDHWKTPIVQERVTGVDLATRTLTTDAGTWHARQLIVDASGPAMVVARAMDDVDEVFPSHARWAYFDLVGVDEGAFWDHLKTIGARYKRYDVPNGRPLSENEDPGWHPSRQTIITQISKTVWTWQIPLYHERLLSFGVVSRSKRLDTDTLLSLATKTHAPHYRLRPRIKEGATSPYDKVHVRTHYARRARTPASMDHVLLGDASAFGDPLYSVGTGMAANKAIELAAILNEEGWTEATCARWITDHDALVDRSLKAFQLWYDGELLVNEDAATEVRQNFLVGTAFQVGIASHYSKVLDDAGAPHGEAGPDGRGRHQVDPNATPLTEPVAELLGVADDHVLAGWTLTSAFPTPNDVQLRWQVEGKPELVVNAQFDPKVTRYYRRVGDISLSFMNLFDEPYPFDHRVEHLFDALERTIGERPDGWMDLAREHVARMEVDAAVVQPDGTHTVT